MINNAVRFAIRNIRRSKLFSAINILGLAISLTAVILMALYIENELSFDDFHTKGNHIFRVADDKQTPEVLLRSAKTAAPVATALKADFPGIEEAVRFISAEGLIQFNEKKFEERRIFFADPGIFDVFSFKMNKGNPEKSLVEPQSIVMSEAMAGKYFGSENPIGKVLSLDGKDMKVTGVIANLPENSHIGFDFLISMSTAQQAGSGYDWLFNNWYSNRFYTYILLNGKTGPAQLAGQLKEFDKRHREQGDATVHQYALEKLSDIYLRSDRADQIGKSGSLRNLYIFSAVGIFLLLIACVNFINLSTARAADRAKEVAVKKVAGAGRGQMILQFFSESFLMTGISLFIALVLCSILLPYFNSFSGKSLMLDLFSRTHSITILSLLLIIGLIAGSYPAAVLSAVKPASALKGKISVTAGNVGIRQGLVIFQFSISIILIVCSLVVARQVRFMQSHELGFSGHQTMVINFEGDRKVQDQYSRIRNELLRVPGIQGVSASSNVPGDGNVNGWSMNFLKKNGDTIKSELPIYLTDMNYLAQYQIPIVAGRKFSEQFPADATESMLINEVAAKTLGFSNPNEALGVKVGMYPNDAVVVGVFKDFHYQSLQKPIAPLTMRVLPWGFRLLSIDINTPKIRQTVAQIELLWRKLAPHRPLEYAFLNDTFNRQYESEIKFGQVFSLFTTLVIIIACSGLFGLTLFSIRQRTKEIGIRKVLGANVASIAVLLSKGFLKLVVAAILVASPISLYIMSKWLEDFSYRISISWWTFIISGGAAVLIAIITVSFLTIKAANANPLKSLRTE